LKQLVKEYDRRKMERGIRIVDCSRGCHKLSYSQWLEGEACSRRGLSLRCSKPEVHVVSTHNMIIQEYKMAVFTIERFLKNAPTQFRLGCLYVIDAICRESRGKYAKEKPLFVSRFSLKLKDTLHNMKGLSEDDEVLTIHLAAIGTHC
jgi:hypothetical protein